MDVFGLNFAANRFKIELFPASRFESDVEPPVNDEVCSGSLLDIWFDTFCSVFGGSFTGIDTGFVGLLSRDRSRFELGLCPRDGGFEFGLECGRDDGLEFGLFPSFKKFEK